MKKTIVNNTTHTRLSSSKDVRQNSMSELLSDVLKAPLIKVIVPPHSRNLVQDPLTNNTRNSLWAVGSIVFSQNDSSYLCLKGHIERGLGYTN